MKPYYQDKWVTIYHGDCREVLPVLDKASAIVTDPPYELGFMGKSWDSKGVSFNKETWEAIRTACKPGAMLLSFGGTRTFHRIACAIEDAGFEYRDTIMYVYGSGFPKSLDVSKAIDKQQGTYIKGELSPNSRDSGESPSGCYSVGVQTKTLPNPQSHEAQLWSGYGTALKPAYEPIIVAMNPLNGTFAQNALKHGVAGLNIDECRIGIEISGWQGAGRSSNSATAGASVGGTSGGFNYKDGKARPTIGRFPANFIHDGSQSVMELFPCAGTGNNKAPYNYAGREYDNKDTSMFNGDKPQAPSNYNDNGSAARFFYCAKASKSERNKGCEELEDSIGGGMQGTADKSLLIGSGNKRNNVMKNNHPTVKPLALMEYLVKLVKMPQYNLIIDPFMGSGTTLLACIKLGIPCIGIDNDEHTCEIAARRCSQEVMELGL